MDDVASSRKRTFLFGGALIGIGAVSALVYYAVSKRQSTLPPAAGGTAPAVATTQAATRAATQAASTTSTAAPVSSITATKTPTTSFAEIASLPLLGTSFIPIYYSRCKLPDFDYTPGSGPALVTQNAVDTIGTWWILFQPTVGSSIVFLQRATPPDVLTSFLRQLEKDIRDSEQKVLVFVQIFTEISEEAKQNFGFKGGYIQVILLKEVDFSKLYSHGYGPNDVPNYTVEDIVITLPSSDSLIPYEYGNDLSCIS